MRKNGAYTGMEAIIGQTTGVKTSTGGLVSFAAGDRRAFRLIGPAGGDGSAGVRTIISTWEPA